MRWIKQLLRRLSIAIIGITIVSSCKNDPQPSKTELLARAWRISTLDVSGKDTFSSLDECIKDNLIIFGKDGSYTGNEGATKCNSQDPQIIFTGTWSFIEDYSKIKIVYANGDSSILIVYRLTKTLLQISYITSYTGLNSVVDIVYTSVPS